MPEISLPNIQCAFSVAKFASREGDQMREGFWWRLMDLSLNGKNLSEQVCFASVLASWFIDFEQSGTWVIQGFSRKCSNLIEKKNQGLLL